MSDHISGPRALSDPIADITDVYAFPTPQRADRLVLGRKTPPFLTPGRRRPGRAGRGGAVVDPLALRHAGGGVFRRADLSLLPASAPPGPARRRGAVHGG